MHEDDYRIVLHDVRSFEVDDRLEMYTRTTTALCYINQHIQIHIDITYSYGCPGIDLSVLVALTWLLLSLGFCFLLFAFLARALALALCVCSCSVFYIASRFPSCMCLFFLLCYFLASEMRMFGLQYYSHAVNRT